VLGIGERSAEHGRGRSELVAAHPEHEPIAIIGIGCRLPGGVNHPDAYWVLLS
jgi:hypothetical protein